MDKNILQPKTSQHNSTANDTEPKRASLTLLQIMALILFLYGVLLKDTVSIWISIGLALVQESQPTIKKFLLLVKEKKFLDDPKKPKND